MRIRGTRMNGRPEMAPLNTGWIISLTCMKDRSPGGREMFAPRSCCILGETPTIHSASRCGRLLYKRWAGSMCSQCRGLGLLGDCDTDGLRGTFHPENDAGKRSMDPFSEE